MRALFYFSLIFFFICPLLQAEEELREPDPNIPVFSEHKEFTVVVYNVKQHDKLRLVEETIRHRPGIKKLVLKRASDQFFLYQGVAKKNLEWLLIDLEEMIGEYFTMESRFLANQIVEFNLWWKEEESF